VVACILGCCLCCGAGLVWKRHKDRQRIVAISIKQLQQMFSRMDSDRSGLVDTSEFCRGFRMPDDLYTARLLKMLDSDDNGYISFKEMVAGISRFHGCTTTHDFAFRLLDAKSEGSVRKEDVLLVIRSVIGNVMAERSVKLIGEQYNTKQVMEFMKDMSEAMTIEHFEEVEMQFPGAFGGVAVIWEQFEDVVEPCARIVANGELGEEYMNQVGVDHSLAQEEDVRGGLLEKTSDSSDMAGVAPGSGSGAPADVEQGGALPEESALTPRTPAPAGVLKSPPSRRVVTPGKSPWGD
jgi:Ca2+-binding EF-hand superfamily protein